MTSAPSLRPVGDPYPDAVFAMLELRARVREIPYAYRFTGSSTSPTPSPHCPNRILLAPRRGSSSLADLSRT
jgi:hypothetical protein